MLETLPIPAFRLQSISAFNAGVQAMRDGQADAAASAWREAIRTDVNLTPAAYNLAVFCEEHGDVAGALDAWGRVLAADPFDTRALVRQASAARQSGDLPRALRSLEGAIRIYPYYRFWYDDLAELLDAMGRAGEATSWRARGEALDTDAIEMAMEDGVRNLRTANWPLAQACFEAILEDWPEAVDAWIRLAQAKAGAGNLAEALHALETALQHADTTPARVHYHRARIQLLAGAIAAAISDLELAVRYEPAYGVAHELLQRARARSVAGVGTAAPNAIEAAPGVSSGRTAAIGSRRDSTSSLGANGDYPVLAAPDPSLPWEDRVRAVIRQASLMPGPTGRPPRIAVILERNAALGMVANLVVGVLSGPEFSKLPDGAQPVYVVEAESRPGEGADGVVDGGWLGSELYPVVDVLRWPTASEPLPIDDLLAALVRDAPNEAFNLVLIIATGRVRTTQNATVRMIRQLPAYQFALVMPTGGSTDLSLRFQGVAPNWVEILV